MKKFLSGLWTIIAFIIALIISVPFMEYAASRQSVCDDIWGLVAFPIVVLCAYVLIKTIGKGIVNYIKIWL